MSDKINPALSVSNNSAPTTLLFLAANPKHTDQLRLDREAREIESRIATAQFRDSFAVKTRWAVRPADLLDALNDYRPSLVHFSGHGDLIGIALEAADGGIHDVGGDGLAALFATVRDEVRCVVLNACSTDGHAIALSKQIQATIGMNDSIGDDAAAVFSAALYRGLASGRSVVSAYEQAIAMMIVEGVGDDDVPKLHKRRGTDLGALVFARLRPVLPAISATTLTVVLDASLDDVDAQKIGQIMGELRKVSGDLRLEIGRRTAGSVRLEVETNEDAAGKILHLHASGQLASLRGLPVVRLEREGLKSKIARQVPSVSVTYARNGASTRANALGMRPMQERAYEKRGEQYLLIKSPPASGKSRALMFIALDKLKNQGLKQAIIVVPEKAIGASFNDEPLSKFGFWADWHVEPKWNLCNAPGNDNGGKVKSLGAFLESDDKVLVCTHATFRFAVDAYGVEKFDDRLVAVDEFHHVSANPDNKLGLHLGQFIARGRTHIVAMTGSYFRGDAEAVLAPSDEAKFDTVTYTYYEQLNGYEYLKQLDIGYFFYCGSYVDDILNVLNPAEKTIIHIPNVNSRESTKDKIREVEHIIETLGEWQGIDAATGFQLVKRPDGQVLHIADLVDDDAAKRDRVSAALKDPAQKYDRDYVDIIIALGMAKEGFDWIWCEHALTVGYRASLTEIVQIIGRATRDAPGKTRARFTNLIAEPDASEQAVTEAVNDTLKAIAASLLMEQVLAPRFEFKPKNADSGPTPGFDYGEGGYDPGKSNVGVNHQTGQVQIEIKGLAEPKGKEATRICQEDLNEVIAAFIQDKTAIERGLFDREELVPEELTVVRMGKIIKDKYPNLDAEDQEAVRQHAIAALTLTQQAKQIATSGESDEATPNTALIDGVRRYAMDVRELEIDLIEHINPFGEAYAILAKAMNEDSLKKVEAAISAKRTNLTPDDAKDLAIRAVQFKKERGRVPALDSQDAWERRMAEGAAAFMRYRKEGRYE